MYKKPLFTIACCLLMSLGAFASTVLLTNDIKKIPLANRLCYIEDTQHQMSYDEVFKLPLHNFLKNDNRIIHFGYTQSTYWFKTVIKNSSDNRHFVLEIENPQLDSIRLYHFVNGNLVAQKGKKELLADKEVGLVTKNSTLVYPFAINKADSVVFVIKMKSVSALKNQLTIYTPEEYANATHLKQFIYSFFTGILCFVFVFSTFLCFVVSDKVYLYYAGYVASFWLTIISISGYFIITSIGKYDLRQLFTFALVVFSLKFTDIFLSLKTYRPLLSKLIKWMIWYVFFCLALYIVIQISVVSLHQHRILRLVVVTLYNGMLIGSCTLLITSIITAIRNGHITGWFYLIGITPVIVTTFFGVLGNTQLISFYQTIDYYYVGAIIFEVTVLSLGLAYRFKAYKDNEERLLVEYSAAQKELLKSLMTGQEIERKRLAKELHDGLGQWLFITKLHVDNLPNEGIDDKIKPIQSYIRRSIDELRHISNDMMPVALIHGGIIPALNEMIEALNATNVNALNKIEAQLYCDPELADRLKNGTEIAVFRIVQEALTNVIKHAKASVVSVQVTIDGDKLKLMIEDNGVGFDQTKQNSGNGIKNIYSRVQLLNGTVEISSIANEGTMLFVDIPLI